jgi:hypothetical protein
MKNCSRGFAMGALLSLCLLACSPVASPDLSSPASSDPAADDDAALVASACADTVWRNCVKTMTAALDLLAGKLVAVCEYGGGDGGVEVISSAEAAAAACSAGTSSETPPPGSSSVTPGRVVTVVQLP